MFLLTVYFHEVIQSKESNLHRYSMSVCIRIVSTFLRYYENLHPTVKNYWLREKAFLGNNVSLNVK